ncbi:MAG TPA: cytochrome c oxidase subunit II [Lacipirellulaceae bacterium]|nr:cytochrome c oxidase subunit II [Lacipirellulaceae bacterium]
MKHFWALVFLMVPVCGVLTFIIAPHYNVWFPKDISANGHVIDHLFMFILWLTGIIFVATEGALFYFAWKYNARSNPEPVKFSHGSHTLEVVWTILPAVTLLFIAIYQMNAWADAKMRRPHIPVTAEITGRQFNWDVRYPGKDGVLHTPDDIVRTDGDIHFPSGEEVLLIIKSQDVLHSFFLPNIRLKQDVVPGMDQYMWFKVPEPAVVDIVCAELCGWGHYKMQGRATFEPRPAFDEWLSQKYTEQESHRVAEAPIQ